jgi:hypothetical protein
MPHHCRVMNLWTQRPLPAAVAVAEEVRERNAYRWYRFRRQFCGTDARCLSRYGPVFLPRQCSDADLGLKRLPMNRHDLPVHQSPIPPILPSRANNAEQSVAKLKEDTAVFKTSRVRILLKLAKTRTDSAIHAEGSAKPRTRMRRKAEGGRTV